MSMYTCARKRGGEKGRNMYICLSTIARVLCSHGTCMCRMSSVGQY